VECNHTDAALGYRLAIINQECNPNTHLDPMNELLVFGAIHFHELWEILQLAFGSTNHRIFDVFAIVVGYKDEISTF
jgi:hypothetical protein